MPSTKLWTITPTAAGIIKSRYPDGNDAAEPPTWATIPDFTQKSGPFTVDISSYLSGSYTSLALTVVTGALTGTGWSLAGSILAYSGTGSGLLTVRIQALNGATVANSNIFTIESIIVLAADTFAPAQVTGLTTSSTSSAVTLTWRPTTDPAPPQTIWAGMARYYVYRDGALLTTIATSAGNQFGCTANSVGTPSAGGSVSQSGSSVTMSGNGSAYFNTADAGQFYGANVSGDFFAYCKVTGFTSLTNASKLMLDARTSLAQDSAHVASVCFPLVAGGVAQEYRVTTGATALRNALAGPNGVVWMALERIGNVWTTYWSVDGAVWTSVSSITVSLPTSLVVGLALSACQVGVTANATVTNFSVALGTSVSYTDSTVAAATSYAYSVVAADAAGNQSAGAGPQSVLTKPAGAAINPPSPLEAFYGIGGAAESLVSPASRLSLMQKQRFHIRGDWINRRDGVTNQTMAQVNALIKNGVTDRLIGIYLNPGEIAKNEEFLTSGVRWDLMQYILNNNCFAYDNGITRANRRNSWFQSPNYYKLNYTAKAPSVAGKQWYQVYIDRMIKAFRTGGAISNSATTSVTQDADPNREIVYFDNVFWRERPNTVNSSGSTCDYNVDGTLDDNNNVATGSDATKGAANTRSSYAAMANYVRSVWPGGTVKILCNMGDWFYARNNLNESVAGSEYDQVFDGGVIEELIGQTYSLETFGNFGKMMLSIADCRAASRADKLVVMTGLVSSATAYAEARYIHGVAAISHIYGHTHINATGGYDPSDIVRLDEMDFNLGYPTASVPTTATYQYSATDGSGIWILTFDNGEVHVAAKKGTGAAAAQSAYAPFTRPMTLYKLRASTYSNQDPTVNNAGVITAGSGITMTSRTAQFYSYTPT